MSEAQRRALLRVLMPAVAVVALLFVGVGALRAAGFACYVVSSPSMGITAPVGSLVVTASLGRRPVHVGEIVAFHPPGQPTAVYVHRTAAVHDHQYGIATRGDANPSPDGWTLRASDLLGRAVAVLPGLGFAVRALPVLVLGGVLVALTTAPIRDRAMRWSVRLTAASATFTIAALLVRPFVGLTVISASTTLEGGVTARIVSTGLLPIAVTGGTHSVVLGPGSTAQLLFERAGSGVRLHASPALDWWQWGCAAAVLLLPTGCSMALARVHRRSTALVG